MKDGISTLPRGLPWLYALRMGLVTSACGWGISFFFTFAPWELATRQLSDMGANPIAYDPLLDYWLRMASCAFGCIGIASALAALRPQKYEPLVRLLGPFHFIVGSVLAVAAWRNGLTPQLHPTFLPDISFCFITACLIQVPLVRARHHVA